MKHFFAKTLYAFFLLAVIFVAITGCQKKDNLQPAPVDEVKGAVRPIGTSLGNIISKQIGPEGGVIKTADDAISISIPAGALAANTIIGIEPVTNTNLAGLGKAYRLMPHGQQFAKPVDLKFSYQDVKDSIAMQEALGLSYQDEKGIWHFMGNHALDTTAKTVTYKSTHFSDWALMPWLVLSPYYKIVSEDEEVDIEALQYIPLKECNCDDDFLVPPVDKGYPVGAPQPLDRKYVKEWKLNGPGFMIAGTDNYAFYKAPAAIPVTYTTAVSLHLKSKHQLILVSNITLLSKDLFEWRFNGGAWKKLDAKLVSLGKDRLAIAFVSGNTSLSITWPTGTMFFPWGTDNYMAAFNYFPETRDKFYKCFYKIDNVDNPSGGGVTITQMGKPGEYCSGSFSLTPSGYYSAADNKQLSSATIEGRFKLKRY